MAKFTKTWKAGNKHSFMGWDTLDTSEGCTEATLAGDLGKRMTGEDAVAFKNLKPDQVVKFRKDNYIIEYYHNSKGQSMSFFDLKAPCVNCPFRRSIAENYSLPSARLEEIINATAFECHKTTGVDGERKEPQQCAGLIAALNAAGRPNQIMQVAERLYGQTWDHIDTDDTFVSIDDLMDGHGHKKGQ